MYKILLCCASGVTTNMLVNKIKESARQQDENIMCWAVGTMSIKYSWPDADCVLVAPQSKADFASIKEMIHGIVPCEMISSQDFVDMNGDAILKQAMQLIDNMK